MTEKGGGMTEKKASGPRSYFDLLSTSGSTPGFGGVYCGWVGAMLRFF